jgi:hypothetical protein
MDELIFAKTYIAIDVDGTIREQSLRGSDAYLSIVDDICSDQYQVVKVMKLWNASISDVTENVVDEVYNRIINEPGEFIPAFLKEHLNRQEYNLLVSVKEHPGRRRIEFAADRADDARQATLEAAE